jgi:hypothetical protein
MAGISNYLEDELLDHIFRAAAYTSPSGIYVKLHLGDPGEAGTTNAAVETTRQQATFGTNSSGGTISNTVAITWTSVSTSETVSHISLWDASTAGNCLWKGQLTTPKVLAAGDNLTIAIGDLDITLD